MAIFRKKITEYSTAVFAIRADTKEDADAAFSEFFHNGGYDDVTYDEYREHMNMNLTDKTEDLAVFDNETQYNFAGLVHDFYLDVKPKSEPSEPLYDLYFYYEEDPNHVKTSCWEGIDMASVCAHINEENIDYILNVSHPRTLNMFNKARKRNAGILVFSLVRRPNNG